MSASTAHISLGMLRLDPAAESGRIEKWIRETVERKLRRKGVVLGLSGGIDSSVVAALCSRAVGPERVLGLLMPEMESSDDSIRFAELVAKSLGISTVIEDISPALQALGCYSRRDDAIRTIVPEYQTGWKCKLVLSDLASGAQYAIASLVVKPPHGAEKKVRLTSQAYSAIVAASNFKQRTRKAVEYFHADRLQYAVAGTPNRLEYDQGFFVKNGDGAADIKPIAHLYKSQVYQLAAFLNLPQEIQTRPSTTDTYSLPQSQEEFYFSVPLETFDLCLFGKNHGISAAQVASAVGMTVEQVERVYASIDAKRRATAYLHRPPLLVEGVGEIAGSSHDSER